MEVPDGKEKKLAASRRGSAKEVKDLLFRGEDSGDASNTEKARTMFHSLVRDDTLNDWLGQEVFDHEALPWLDINVLFKQFKEATYKLKRTRKQQVDVSEDLKLFKSQKVKHREDSGKMLLDSKAAKLREAQDRRDKEAQTRDKSSEALQSGEEEWQHQADAQKAEENGLRRQLDACMERDVQAMMARKHSMEAYKAEISVLKAQIKEASGLVARSLKPIQLPNGAMAAISRENDKLARVVQRLEYTIRQERQANPRVNAAASLRAVFDRFGRDEKQHETHLQRSYSGRLKASAFASTSPERAPHGRTRKPRHWSKKAGKKVGRSRKSSKEHGEVGVWGRREGFYPETTDSIPQRNYN